MARNLTPRPPVCKLSMLKIGPNPDQKRPFAYGENAMGIILSVPGTFEFRENIKKRANSEKSKNR